MPKLPDRWESYSNIGSLIPGTRFITFKVPLREELCQHYDNKELWFTPQVLVETTRQLGLDLGLVIDLTFTKRYYPQKLLEDEGVTYEKIFVPGHHVPSDDIIWNFFSVVDKYLQECNDDQKIIGVHCTHGVNRTGYCVARYMIERLGMNPQEAINAIGIARGYPIEREAYLADLQHRSLAEIIKCYSNLGLKQADPEFILQMGQSTCLSLILIKVNTPCPNVIGGGGGGNVGGQCKNVREWCYNAGEWRISRRGETAPKEPTDKDRSKNVGLNPSHQHWDKKQQPTHSGWNGNFNNHHGNHFHRQSEFEMYGNQGYYSGPSGYNSYGRHDYYNGHYDDYGSYGHQHHSNWVQRGRNEGYVTPVQRNVYHIQNGDQSATGSGGCYGNWGTGAHNWNENQSIHGSGSQSLAWGRGTYGSNSSNGYEARPGGNNKQFPSSIPTQRSRDKPYKKQPRDMGTRSVLAG